jgi:hypothetical protein
MSLALIPLLAGFYLVLLSFIVSTRGIFYIIVVKFIPFLLGCVCLWYGAVLYGWLPNPAT